MMSFPFAALLSYLRMDLSGLTATPRWRKSANAPPMWW
jgi:hypothetical protein